VDLSRSQHENVPKVLGRISYHTLSAGLFPSGAGQIGLQDQAARMHRSELAIPRQIWLVTGLFIGEASVLNAAMDESTTVTLATTFGIVFSIVFWIWIIWVMKRSGWQPLIWVIAVVAVRRLVFYARWITEEGVDAGDRCIVQSISFGRARQT
jgi:hypothetical protein